jgi:hypothetical protein
MIGHCPQCGSEVLEGEQDFYCRSNQCKFRIGGVVLGQVLHRSQVEKYLPINKLICSQVLFQKQGRSFQRI